MNQIMQADTDEEPREEWEQEMEFICDHLLRTAPTAAGVLLLHCHRHAQDPRHGGTFERNVKQAALSLGWSQRRVQRAFRQLELGGMIEPTDAGRYRITFEPYLIERSGQ